MEVRGTAGSTLEQLQVGAYFCELRIGQGRGYVKASEWAISASESEVVVSSVTSLGSRLKSASMKALICS